VFSSKKFNRHVTGITISNEGFASIGRNKKRQLRSKVFEAEKLASKEIDKLRGYIAFSAQVEPEFLNLLWKKYPSQMSYIMKFQEK
jgi:RNA-directed DNA polymerase